MCFSAKASFAASGALYIIGLLCIRKTNKQFLPLATTPLIFAIQQASEGLVWIALTNGSLDFTYNIGMYTFIFCAGVWWPSWIAAILYFLENNQKRKNILLRGIMYGLFTSGIYLLSLLTQPCKAFIVDHHIYYPTLAYPFYSSNTITEWIELIIPITYLLATVIPWLVSSVKYMWIIGIISGIAWIISNIYFIPTSASTWCFFAAMISALIYIILPSDKTKNKSI